MRAYPILFLLLIYYVSFVASILAAERRNFRARAAPPKSGAVSRFFKKLLLQWRSKSGRWHVAASIQHLLRLLASGNFWKMAPGLRPVLLLNNCHPGSHLVRQAHRFYDQARIVSTWAE
jgi:hypothetical protein